MAFDINLFRKEANFVAGVATKNMFPNFHLPEIAFLGKSNVGKSSLINKLLNRRSLARVSHTPGRTQQINFFSLVERLLIVDLPGYGFAKVPLLVKQQWEHLVLSYLSHRKNLAFVVLLIDIRRNIHLKDIDIMKFMLQHDVKFQIVLTKADKTPSYHEESLQLVRDCLLENNIPIPHILLVSSRNNLGIKELRHSIISNLNQL
jgi:GTP-binding protein